jgi:hypothetical protein
MDETRDLNVPIKPLRERERRKEEREQERENKALKQKREREKGEQKNDKAKREEGKRERERESINLCHSQDRQRLHNTVYSVMGRGGSRGTRGAPGSQRGLSDADKAPPHMTGCTLPTRGE